MAKLLLRADRVIDDATAVSVFFIAGMHQARLTLLIYLIILIRLEILGDTCQTVVGAVQRSLKYSSSVIVYAGERRMCVATGSGTLICINSLTRLVLVSSWCPKLNREMAEHESITGCRYDC